MALSDLLTASAVSPVLPPAANTAPEAASVQQGTVNVINVDMGALNAEAERAIAVSDDALEASLVAGHELEEELGPEVCRHVRHCIEDVHDNMHSAWFDVLTAEFARHRPMMAPAIWAISAHVWEGRPPGTSRCCKAEEA